MEKVGDYLSVNNNLDGEKNVIKVDGVIDSVSSDNGVTITISGGQQNKCDKNEFDIISNLPIEITLQIAQNLVAVDLWSSSEVNKSWRKLFNSHWKGFNFIGKEIEAQLSSSPNSSNSQSSKRNLKPSEGSFESSLPSDSIFSSEFIKNLHNFPVWKRNFWKFRKIEENFKKNEGKTTEITVDNISIAWFQIHKDTVAICTKENSLHIASLNSSKILHDIYEFHEFSAEIQPFVKFSSTGRQLVFAVRNYIKVCGVENDWNQNVIIEILSGEDFVRCIPAVTEKCVAFGYHRLTIYNLLTQRLHYQSNLSTETIKFIEFIDDNIIYIQGTTINYLNTTTLNCSSIKTGHGYIRCNFLDTKKNWIFTGDKEIYCHNYVTGKKVKSFGFNCYSNEDCNDTIVTKERSDLLFATSIDVHNGYLLACDCKSKLYIFDMTTTKLLYISSKSQLGLISSANFLTSFLILCEDNYQNIQLLDWKANKFLRKFPKKLNISSNQLQVLNSYGLAYIDEDGKGFVRDFSRKDSKDLGDERNINRLRRPSLRTNAQRG